MIEIIGLAIFFVLCLFWIISLLVGVGIIKGPIRKWFHDKFRWHDGKGKQWFDGCSVHSICSQCGEEVMQDGQGNWF